MTDNMEPILQPNEARYIMKPIKHDDIWRLFNLQRKTFWNESEVPLSGDLDDWKKLNDDERFFIKRILAFFAASDGIVMENISFRFLNEIQIPEARALYAAQAYIEVIHSIMYSDLIQTYITDQREQEFLFNAIQTIPIIKKKAEWAKKWINSSDNYATRMVAFACVEGIHFSGAFCAIFWLKERGLMKGLIKSNEWISRDEALHTDAAILIYRKKIVYKLSDETVHSIIKEALAIEKEFIIDSIPCNLIGMNSDLMIEYIEYVANRLCVQLGHTPFLENTKCPFAFMDRICFQNKSNFFEENSSDYQNSVDREEGELDFDCDV